MGCLYKIVLVIYVLTIAAGAHPSTQPGSDFDVDVFAETSDCMKMGKIMNGAIATHEMFPYLVSIQTSSIGQHLCGGTLLTPYHVLTAAHCTFVKPGGRQFSPKELQIRIGPSNLRLPARVIARVAGIKIHEGYKQRPVDNDIAVIKVDKPLTSQETDIPCISSSFITPSSTLGPCIAAGWGRLGPNPSSMNYTTTLDTFVSPTTNNSYSSTNNQTLNETIPTLNTTTPSLNLTYHAPIGQNSSQVTNSTSLFNESTPVVPVIPSPANVSSAHNESGHAYNQSDHVHDATTYVPKEIALRFTLLPLQDVKECAKDYGTADLTDEVLCAGKRNSKTDTCKGDSGGPLICDGKIEGIVSFGDGCDNPQHLGVYTRVYKHLGWIHNQIRSGSVSYQQTSNVIFVVLISVLVLVSSVDV